MKKLLFLTFMFAFNSSADVSRAPAVLDGSCNLNITTTITEKVNGKEVTKDRPLEDVLKDQCIEVRKCMNSAEDEDMENLKNLEQVACNNKLRAVTTKTPGAVVEDKNFDGKRKAKITNQEQELKAPKTDTPTAIIK